MSFLQSTVTGTVFETAYDLWCRHRDNPLAQFTAQEMVLTHLATLPAEDAEHFVLVHPFTIRQIFDVTLIQEVVAMVQTYVGVKNSTGDT